MVVWFGITFRRSDTGMEMHMVQEGEEVERVEGSPGGGGGTRCIKDRMARRGDEERGEYFSSGCLGKRGQEAPASSPG